MLDLNLDGVNAIILTCCILGLLYSLLCAYWVSQVKIQSRNVVDGYTEFDENEELYKVSELL